jgi:cytochrome c oxidase subunit III
MADAHAHAKPHHAYHLVDPSPWPIVGSVSAFVMAVGAITWMHHVFAAAPFIFAAGAIGILYMFIGWWRDVSREATYEGHHSRLVQISHRYGMMLFIASEVMFFVAWFWPISIRRCFPPTRISSRAISFWADNGRRRESKPSIRGICRCSTRSFC